MTLELGLIIVLFAICIIQQIIMVTPKSLGEELSPDLAKLNVMYAEFMRPLAEEYKTLKGYSEIMLHSDSVHYGNKRDDNSGCYNWTEHIAYTELPKKLEQLKADMKRGCEVYCKEKDE